MKPHDEWNSADIADHARRAMQMETLDYGDEPKPVYRPGWLALALAVAFWLVLALLIAVSL